MDSHSWKLTVLTVLLLITGMVIPVSAFAQPVDAQYDIYDELTVEMPDDELYVHDEIIVKFSPGVSEEKIANINARNGAKVKYTSQYAGFKVLKIPGNRNAQKMAQLYSKNPNVEYAVPNAIMTAAAVNDPYYSYQWNFHSPNGINIEPAWDMSTGEGVIVAVLDTGVAYENYGEYIIAPDLKNTDFIQGKDVINNDDHPNDDNNHGTHVAGTIAQSTNNGIGVAGIAYDCSIMPVKVLNADGNGNLGHLIDGITFATDNGADVISMSLSFGPGVDPGEPLYAALDHAYENGVTIVAAAGNDGTGVVGYPAAYDKCIAVGATGYDGQLAPYSNYGDAIDVVAPGGNTAQDKNGDGYGDGILQNTFSSDPTVFGYWFWQGTSMATPHVSGVAALLIAMDPDATNDEIRDAIESSARDMGTPDWDSTYGHGLIDAKAALDALNNEPVQNLHPNADAGGPYTADVGTAISFDGSGSEDIDGTIVSYEWNFGDGSNGSGITTTHTYTNDETYTATLTVTDDDGAQDTDTATVIINAPATIKEQIHIGNLAVNAVDYPVRKKTFVNAEANVKIVDDNGTPVEGATVSGQWSVSANNPASDDTNPSGEVTLSSDSVMLKRSDLTFTFAVTDVTHPDYDWDGTSLSEQVIYYK